MDGIEPNELESAINDIESSGFTQDETVNVELEPIEDAPVESPTQTEEERVAELLHDQTTTRFNSAEWFDTVKDLNVTIAGVGGIGSHTSLLLARCGISNLILVDPDTVEEVNLAGQLYKFDDIGKNKTGALGNTIRQYSNIYCNMYAQVLEEWLVNPITICGFDNMQARKEAFMAWKFKVTHDSLFRKQALFIDGRLTAEEFQVFCITGDDTVHMKEYKDRWLFDDKDAVEAPCSYKQTTFCSNMIASVICNLFVNFCSNIKFPSRVLPFITTYDATTMQLKTKN